MPGLSGGLETPNRVGKLSKWENSHNSSLSWVASIMATQNSSMNIWCQKMTSNQHAQMRHVETRHWQKLLLMQTTNNSVNKKYSSKQ